MPIHFRDSIHFSALKRWDAKINTPPSVDTVQEQFVNNLDDINAVVSFMQSSGYEGFFIQDSSGTASFFIQDSTELASSGSRTIQIQDNEIRSAIKHLFHNRNYLDISKIGNTVTLLQWRGACDVGCGIIYTNNVEESINTEFVTELIPISEDGWYYYVSDYNAWRNGQRGSADQQSSDQPNGPVPDFSGTGSSANGNDTSGNRTSYQNAKISYQGKQYIYRCPNFIYDAENVEEIGALTYSSEIKNDDLSTDSMDLNGCDVIHLSGGLTGDALLVNTGEILGSLYFPEDASYSALYEYEENSDGSITIIKYRGDAENVVIPSQIDGKNVSAIGNNFHEEGAFSNCTSVVTVTVPEGVTVLEDNAFYGCFGLKEIYLPESLTLIRNCGFNACPELTSIHFAGDAPQIGNYVFDGPISKITLYYPKDRAGWDSDLWSTFSRKPY